MNRHRVVRTFFRNLTGLLSYSLVLLLCAPFSVAGRARRSLLPMLQPGSAVQATARREGELLVKFRSGASQRDKDIVLASHGMRHKKQLRGYLSVEHLEVPGGRDANVVAQQQLSNHHVEFAEPNYLISKDQITPTDPQFTEQWALRNTGQTGGQFGSDIKVEGAWNLTVGSPSTVIAIIDSGIDFNYLDLHNNQWSNLNPGQGALGVRQRFAHSDSKINL